ncbi:MAG: SpoIIE family protein phosphatase, partial [Bacteroidota bacterium]
MSDQKQKSYKERRTAKLNQEYRKELDNFLVQVQERADRISDKFIIGFFALGFVLAPVYQTWVFSLVVGGTSLAIYLISRFVLTNRFIARMLISSVYAIFMLQFIGQMHGMAEMHFFFFTNIAILIVYEDWRIMIPYAILTVSHHTGLAILQLNADFFNLNPEQIGSYFISYGGKTIEGENVRYVTAFQLFFHFGAVVLMAFIAGLWAVRTRRNTIYMKVKSLEAQQLTEELQASEEELRTSLDQIMSHRMVSEEARKKSDLLLQKVRSGINYALRIQNALLPSEKDLKKQFDCFVFYQACDIVSGDFYWFAEKRNKRIIAVGDCTGHGVSGALMTVIANNLLDQVVNTLGIIKPASILNRLSPMLAKTLEHDEGKVADGMDLSIISFELTPEGDIHNLEFAGAMNSLYIVKGGELNEIKADKRAISARKVKGEYPIFENHIVPRESYGSEGMLYLFSDGFKDQFGGSENKKYMSRRFKELLVSISLESVDKQKEALRAEFQRWRGDHKQIDDVIVFG